MKEFYQRTQKMKNPNYKVLVEDKEKNYCADMLKK